MKNSRDYRMIPFTFNRKMVKASATVARGHNTIHAVMEADISGIRRRMRDHKKETGESLSMTAFWFIPLGAATVLITVGGIGEKLVLVDGKPKNREHLSLTASFDHDIVDWALSARFVKRLKVKISSEESGFIN